MKIITFYTTLFLASILFVCPVFAEVTPQDFYTSFNMRTIRSSFGPGLKGYCGTYPKDFFKPHHVTYKKNKILLETDEDYWELELIDDNHFKMINKIKIGTYHSRSVHKFYVVPETGEIRCGEIFIPEKENCKPYPIPD